jgi:RNA polymerase sigma-70 factor (ECF subfamily)
MSTTTLTRPRGRDIGAGEVLEALRAGDEAAFAALVDECRPAMLRVAEALTPTRAGAEAAVREAWLDVLHGLDDFDGRSTVRAWAMRLLADRVAGDQAFTPVEAGVPAVAPDRFLPAGRAAFAGHWAQAPASWDRRRLSTPVVSELLRDAVAALPPGERVAITLRDVNGWSAEEVSDALGLSRAKQRTLLHRGRSALHAVLDAHLTTAAA